MAEETSFGVRRLRQAITNQATCGGQFELSIDSADRLCCEIEAELARLAWAAGVPVPRDADGEVVPLTTRLMYTNKGEIIRVWDTCFDGHAWYVKGIDRGKMYLIGKLYLAQPDSWKKLEEDVQKIAGEGICGYFGAKACDESCPAKCAPVSCSMYALKDILHRAKALAGRGED